MNSLSAIAQHLRDLASHCDTATNGIHPVLAHRMLRDHATDLHTCANRLHQAERCGIGPDGDITLALTLATAHQEHQRGDVKAALDKLMEAFAYIQQQERASA